MGLSALAIDKGFPCVFSMLLLTYKSITEANWLNVPLASVVKLKCDVF